MDALNHVSLAFFLTLLPILGGCTSTVHSSGPDRAITMYHESLGPGNAVSFRPDRAASEKKESAGIITEATPKSLTVDVAVDLAKKNSARRLALEASVLAAEANVAAADRVKNPELRASQMRLDELMRGAGQARAALRFFPERPGAVKADIAAAKVKHAQALAELRLEELTIEADVRWAFDDVVLLEAEIAAARAIAQTRQSLAAQMQARLAASEATSLDEALAELSSLEADADLAQHEARKRAARSLLLDRVGLPPDAEVEIIGDPPLVWPPPPLPAEKVVVEQALRSSPEVALAAAKMDAADAQTFAERAKRLPWFTFLEVGYEFTPKTTPGLGWTFQGGMDLPIFDTNSNGVTAANATRTAAERAFEAEVERVVRDVRARIRDVQAAEVLVTQYRARALPIAEKAGKEAQRSLEARNIDTVRALSVDERRAVVQLRLLRLIRGYRNAMSELRRTSGNVNSAVTP
jgi:outer membrane protein, heavy metal efflux system